DRTQCQFDFTQPRTFFFNVCQTVSVPPHVEYGIDGIPIATIPGYSYQSCTTDSFTVPASPPAWKASQAYAVNDVVTSNGNVYVGTTAGTSAASGAGPAGNFPAIADNTVTWRFVTVTHQFVPTLGGDGSPAEDSPLGGAIALGVARDGSFYFVDQINGRQRM